MKLSKFKIFVASAAIVISASCNKQLNGYLDNPSVATPAAADADLYLNNLQLHFKNFYQTVSDYGDQLTRMQTMFGPTYFNAYSATSFDGIWNEAYLNIFKTANTMIPLVEAKGQYVHEGIAQIMKAYTMITLVDIFGDIPYSQANLALENANPALDKGKDVYDSAMAYLDAAIANLAKTPSNLPATDMYYGGKSGTAAYWTKLAKTIKLKALIQTRLVDASAAAKVQALITENNLINTVDDDFVFSYSKNALNPDSRAPHYVGNYGTSSGAGDYIGTYFLWALRDEKSSPDPRTPYYVYRQIVDINNDSRLPDQTTTQFAIPCLYRTSPYPAGTCYCIVDNGYWGRDHGNNEGIPPDNSLRTTYGVYPAGGQFDARQNTPVGTGSKQTVGAGGNGINPIWMSSFTQFLKAEAMLTMGVSGDPKAAMMAGIGLSMSKVAAFPASIGFTITSDTTYLITDFKKTRYNNAVSALYDAAATTDAKLNVVIKEYYLSAWGNGVEPYNNYRRTGKPSNLQPALGGNAGNFIRSYWYPSVYVNFNKNAVQKTTQDVKVFWDNNPDNFVQ